MFPKFLSDIPLSVQLSMHMPQCPETGDQVQLNPPRDDDGEWDSAGECASDLSTQDSNVDSGSDVENVSHWRSANPLGRDACYAVAPYNVKL